MDNKNSKNIANLLNMMRKNGYCDREGDCLFSSLSGDGSDRSFLRIKTAEDTSFIGVLPTHSGSQKKTISWPAAKDIYMEIIETLLFMQISGSVRFNRKWCWDTQRYDKKTDA